MAVLGFVLNEDGTEWVPAEAIETTHPPAPVIAVPRDPTPEAGARNSAFLDLVSTVQRLIPSDPSVSADIAPSGPAAPQITLKEVAGSRCPYCRDDVTEGAPDAHECSDCGTMLHLECWGELNAACPTLGCSYRMRHRARTPVPETLRVSLTPREALQAEVVDAAVEVLDMVEEEAETLREAARDRHRLMLLFALAGICSAIAFLLLAIS